MAFQLDVLMDRQLGNPGLVDFYTPFLSDIHVKSRGELPIIARAHLGHTPHIDEGEAYNDRAAISLTAQIVSIVELIDVSKSVYDKIILVGHSVGSWLVLQVCHRASVYRCILMRSF